MLEQCCNLSKQCPNNVATLCCAKGRCCESSRVTSPSNVQFLQTLRFQASVVKIYVISPLKVIPILTSICLSVLVERKNGIFFLVCENFVLEHFFFLCRLRGIGEVFQVRRRLKLKKNGFLFYVCSLFCISS